MRVDVKRKAHAWARISGRCLALVLVVIVLLSAPLSMGVSAQGGTALPEEGVQTNGIIPVPIRTNPTTLTVGLNSTFDLNIIVEAGTNYVKAADLRLTYDREYLRVTADATPGRLVNLSNGGFWLWNSYNNTTGNTKFAFMLIFKRMTGTFRICTLHLKAVKRTPPGSPALITAWTGNGAPMLCDRYGQRVPSTWIDTQVTVR